jgi:hypothetical protein
VTDDETQLRVPMLTGMDDQMWTYPCRQCGRYTCRCAESARAVASCAEAARTAHVREWTPSWWTAMACNA